MSQNEILVCLMKLGGYAEMPALVEEYNKLHFPRNIGYKFQTIKEVKKTMQGDTSKLIRDNMIERIITRPTNIARSEYISRPRLITSFRITEYGWNIIYDYKLSPIQQVH